MRAPFLCVGFGLLVLTAAPRSAGSALPVPSRSGTPLFPKGVTITRLELGNLRLTFEENRGQADSRVRFLARGNRHTLLLTADGGVFGVHSQRNRGSGRFRVRFVGANPTPNATGIDRLPGESNYFIGSDPSKWRTHVRHFAAVRYSAVYPGIDVVYYGKQRGLEYDLVIRPGADPEVIEISLDAPCVIKEALGDVVLRAGGGELRIAKPYAYQETDDGLRQSVDCAYVFKKDGRVGFELGRYDTARPLVIDPVLVFATYLGGGEYELGSGVAVDSAGDVYVTGTTTSANFPIEKALQDTYSGPEPRLFLGGDVFVAKLDATGTALAYSTYLGGRDSDEAHGIAVDAAGNAYLTGETESADFPVVSPIQPSLKGSSDAFVAKLDRSGSVLVYSTYLGGSGYEGGWQGGGIAVDNSGNAYVTGTTDSTDFPTANPFQSTRKGGTCSSWNCSAYFDAFVAKLNASGSALLYSTYLGGDLHDQGDRIAVDSEGNAYVSGWTSSTNFPIANALQSGLHGGSDAFVTKIGPAGALVYSTYLGGSVTEGAGGIAVDSGGSVYLTGGTSSPDFPTVNAFQATFGGAWDAFVAKIDPAGSRLVYSTYLGGNRDDFGGGIAVDRAGNVYVAGSSISIDFPLKFPFYSGLGGAVFVAKLDASGSVLLHSSNFGGIPTERGEGAGGIAINSEGNAFVVGSTSSVDFSLAAPLQKTYGGGAFDVFVAKIAFPLPSPIIPNGDFETPGEGGFPRGWETVWSNSGAGDAFRYDSGGDSFDGTSVLRLHVSPGGGSVFVLSAPIAVSPATDYLITAQMRFSLTSETDTVFFSISQFDDSGRAVGFDEATARRGDSSWDWRPQRLQIRSAPTATSIRIRIGIETAGESYLDVDGVR